MKEFIPVKSLDELRIGDIVRGKTSTISFVVVDHYGVGVTAVRIADVTNPPEWEVLREVSMGDIDEMYYIK